jgi:outer membrane protein OmpA-like peptidoglycan-associated protein
LPLLALIPLLGYFMSRSPEPRREAAVRTPAPRVETRRSPEPTRPVGTTGTTAALTAVGPYRLEFATDSGELTAASAEQLSSIASVVKSHPRATLQISGHTDNVGDEGHNMDLSRRRATAVTDRIESLGVDRSRMTTTGHGENDPVADNATAEGRQENRRVEIRITER